jgi:hypothetical protein
MIWFQADNLTSEIYNIDWYNTKNLKICKFVLFWLARSQTPVQMSGVGIVKVNRQVLLQVKLNNNCLFICAKNVLQIQRLGFSVTTMLTGLK